MLFGWIQWDTEETQTVARRIDQLPQYIKYTVTTDEGESLRYTIDTTKWARDLPEHLFSGTIEKEPMTTLEELLEKANLEPYVTKPDIINMYFQSLIKEEDQSKEGREKS
jgi:hypothetical protein